MKAAAGRLTDFSKRNSHSNQWRSTTRDVETITEVIPKTRQDPDLFIMRSLHDSNTFYTDPDSISMNEEHVRRRRWIVT